MPAYEAYGTNYNTYGQTDINKEPWRQQQPRSFFPNITPYGNPINPVQQRINAMPRLSGNQLTTYTLPSGGQVTIPAGSRVPNYYQQNNLATPSIPPRTPAQRFDMNQARVAGEYSGIPLTSTQQIGGGQYNVRQTPYGGVASPTSPAPNFFSRQLSNLYAGLSAFPAIAQGIFGGGGTASYAGQTGTGFQNQNYAQNQPRRYFDPSQNYGF